MKKLLVVTVMSLILSGCFPGLRNQAGESASKPGEFVKGKAVKGFPDIPLYPEARLIETFGSEGSYGANAYTNDELLKVVKFYEDGLPQLSWNTSLEQDESGNYVFTINNQTQKGWVIVNTAADNKTVAITISVTVR